MKKTGEWVFILKPVPTEIPVGRMEVYFAKPTEQPYLWWSRTHEGLTRLMHRYAEGLNTDTYQDYVYRFLTGKKIPKRYRDGIEYDINRFGYEAEDFVTAVKIVTPFGEVKLWDDEYKVVSLDWALHLAGEEALMIRYLNNDGSVRDGLKNVSVRDQVFYLQSRGISFKEAMKMVQGEIKSQHLFYFDPYPHYVHVYERNYEEIAKRKIKYCIEKGQEQLLMYKDSENGEFTIQDYLKFLELEEV